MQKMKKLGLIILVTLLASLLSMSVVFAQADQGTHDLSVGKVWLARDVTDPANPPPSINVVKTANPTQVVEPGGLVTFSVVIYNTSLVDHTITINSLLDDVHGNLNGQGTCSVPQTIPFGGSYTCFFIAQVSGNAGYVEVDTVVATGTNQNGIPVSDWDDATVTVIEPPPDINVLKTAAPTSLPEPGGWVTFTVVITNNSGTTDPVTITDLFDQIGSDVYDLDGQGTCDLPVTIHPGASYTCYFLREVVGVGGYVETDTVTAYGSDDEGTPVSDYDDADVTLTPLPALQVTKTADPASLPEPGGDVLFTYVVDNIGVVDVTITSLEDDVFGVLAGDADCQVGTLLPVGASCEFSITRPVEGDYGDPAHVNVFTAVAEDEFGNFATEDDDATVVFTDVLPEIQVTKTADPTSIPEPGGEVLFTYVVENIGIEDVTITSLEDDVFGVLAGDADCQVGTFLPVGATCAFTVTQAVEGDYGDPDHVNVFTAVAEDDEGNPASDDDDAVVEFTDVLPTIQVIKTTDPTTVQAPGGLVTFTVVVSNESEAEVLTINSLVDSIYGNLDGRGTCDVPQTLDVGESYICQFTEMVEGVAGDSETDVVTATGEDDDGNQVEDDDDATVTITPVGGLPVIEVVKTADPVVVQEPGGDVVFTVVVANNSAPDVPVTITSLVDNIHGDLNGQGTCSVPQTIQPGESYTCEFTAPVEGAAGDSETDIVNAEGEDEHGNPVSDSDDAIVEIVTADGLPEIEVDKTANPSFLPEPGGEVTFTVVVTNLSNPDDPVTITSMVDDIHGDLNGQGTCSVPQTIQPGESYTCEFTTLVEGASGDFEIDTVTAEGEDDEGNKVDDSDDAKVVIGMYKVYLPNAESEKVIESLVPMTLGYEDLDLGRPDMDFDYNDWVAVIDTRLLVDEATQDLYRINFFINPEARGGVRSHAYHILIPADTFTGDGSATLTIWDNSGNVVSSEDLPFDASQDNDFVVLPFTSEAFPLAGEVVNAFEDRPYHPTQRTAELSIQFYDPGPFNQEILTEERISIPHGEGLFFDPYLEVLDREAVIHKGDLRMLSVPDINWAWPEERVRLDVAYPDVSGNPPNFTFAENWWLNHNTCVYGDGVKCSSNLDYMPFE